MTYSDLIRLPTFEERYEVLRTFSKVGEFTFGSHRYLNQSFYTSSEWRRFRREIIVRDNGCDLAIPDRSILLKSDIVIHHINPVSIDDIVDYSELLMDPENVICVSKNTHRAIHYGDFGLLVPSEEVERRPNDTCPWK